MFNDFSLSPKYSQNSTLNNLKVFGFWTSPEEGFYLLVKVYSFLKCSGKKGIARG